MNARSLHPSAQNASRSDQPSASGTAAAPAGPADVPGRACCCPAKAAVRVLMPATEARPYEADLLLCGHHYRVSRRALAEARAVIFELPGISSDTAAWIGMR